MGHLHSVAMLLPFTACMPADFDRVERTRDMHPITECDAGDAASCPDIDADVPEDASDSPGDAARDAADDDADASDGSCTTCKPGDTTACANGDECGHRVCTSACAWGPCVPREANGCLRIGPGHTEQGTNFECCGDGRWRFCVPGCRWSDLCNPCTPENCAC